MNVTTTRAAKIASIIDNTESYWLSAERLLSVFLAQRFLRGILVLEYSLILVKLHKHGRGLFQDILIV
ncbi:hypothetical protein G7B40_032865 [Aetokthonos hydrillicola Thurmond2011]|jgi:hypothetical protein|uniref:Uncharacterized protein n=1 Tax=Aetokthonos hydrillicola Thurmond2011 TaxID=2712845 RepID=A0AAP5IF84_9CYAN|nr:hypothetical protein [Aetokthonos hydrillicola]MBO3464286.1 hypothetical protein [Aetokthonos hydrillicola CCALA 1050]MBW4585815.1 hypothetical protein [Aetokthonos hydrillicola CCALA 1050]MDR9899319.1 hypothetical protein [Aetokthonos hydrillicola Thurmond2011]